MPFVYLKERQHKAYQSKQVLQKTAVFASSQESAETDLLELRKQLSLLAAQDVTHLRREHKGGSLTLKAKLAFEVAKVVPKVDVEERSDSIRNPSTPSRANVRSNISREPGFEYFINRIPSILAQK